MKYEVWFDERDGVDDTKSYDPTFQYGTECYLFDYGTIIYHNEIITLVIHAVHSYDRRITETFTTTFSTQTELEEFLVTHGGRIKAS